MTLAAVLSADRLSGSASACPSRLHIRVVEEVKNEPAQPETRREIRVMNAVALRRSFPGLWAEYLRENFASAYAVHRAFPGLDEKTCRDWWNGKSAPSGVFVAVVVKADPRALEILGRDA
jgi:hypothetical protein